jgi:Skp family chaperone for outer membrane proteins
VLNVKRSFLVATLVATVSLSIGLRPGRAQQPPVSPTPQRATVVVIDLGAVFKQHNRFNQEMEVMKKDVADFENFLRDQGERVNKLREQLKQYNPGTPDYNLLEKKIHQTIADLQVESQLKRKQFMEQEAKLYYNVYDEVTRAVARFANENGISLVLRYNSDPIDPADRASVLAGVNNPIVFQRNLDITGIIVEYVNRNSTAGKTVPAGPQIPRPR